MNKVLAFSILGMGLTGAVLVISVALWFKSPIGNMVPTLTAGSLVAFVIFAISAFVFRRRLNELSK